MRYTPLAMAAMLAACAADPAPEPPAPQPQVIVEPAETKREILPLPPIPVNGTPSIKSLTPHELLIAAEQARADAFGYVGWRHSKPDNIERLTTLTRALNSAVETMQTNKANGHYAAADVVAARAALSDLREFLATKGD